MKPPSATSAAVQVAIAAIVVLGWVGGSLIVAHSGFATSPKRGGTSVFVPAPQAYVLAATMYGMSLVGLLALLSARRASKSTMAVALVVYVALAVALTASLRSH